MIRFRNMCLIWVVKDRETSQRVAPINRNEDQNLRSPGGYPSGCLHDSKAWTNHTMLSQLSFLGPMLEVNRMSIEGSLA